jgi:3-oxoacyl-[acyl-carrier protein] reductase
MAGLLEGKRCVVTGGTRGLGRAIVVELARQGARVAFTYSRSDADAEETASEVRALGGEVLVLKGSVADVSHIKEATSAIVSAWGGIDVLVNNAGVTQVLPVSLLEETDWDLVMDVNVKGAYLFTRSVLKSMIRNRAGSILFIGSFASERVVESPIHFASSKSALRGMTESLAREVGRYGIRVNLVAPGLLDVGMAQTLPQHRQREYVDRSALGRIGRASEIAKSIAFLVSDENSFMSGAKVVLDGGV